MARFTMDGLDELELDMEKLAELPDSVVLEMAKAGAEVVKAKQAEAARSMLAGEHTTGTTANSLTVEKLTKTGGGAEATISFKGSRPNGRKSKRNAEVAFINNYGKKGQPARPFVTAGNDAAEEDAAEAATQVYFAYMGL